MTFSQEPRMTVQEQHQQGIELFNNGKYREAVGIFSNLLQSDNSSEMWNNWASAQAAAGAFEEAEKGFKKALQIAPNNDQAAKNLELLVGCVTAHGQSTKYPGDELLLHTGMSEEMKRNWDFVEKRELLYALVGYDFGMEPETKLDEIRVFKKKESAFLLHALKFTPEDVVLDLGSGCGFIARVVAPLCRQIYCLDISSEFLRFASEELAEFKNVGFHRMPYGNLHYLDNKKITKGYANAVFIHFNFFDVVVYLREIYRILAPGGLFLFGLSNTDCLDIHNDRYFSLVLSNYVKDRTSPTLMQWNSARGVCAAARQIGFEASEVWVGHGSAMILIRKPSGVA
jgi:ubiquinone/menaquinone biosynthesis C-methylase UbiE